MFLISFFGVTSENVSRFVFFCYLIRHFRVAPQPNDESTALNVQPVNYSSSAQEAPLPNVINYMDQEAPSPNAVPFGYQQAIPINPIEFASSRRPWVAWVVFGGIMLFITTFLILILFAFLKIVEFMGFWTLLAILLIVGAIYGLVWWQNNRPEDPGYDAI